MQAKIGMRVWSLSFALAIIVLVQAAPPFHSSTPRSETPGASHVCGDVIYNATQTKHVALLLLKDKDYVVDAVDVRNCYCSVPFNADVASRLLEYLNGTLQFQSNLDYLKHPPPGYQQPAADLIAGLNSIQDSIHNASFRNEYQFEAALLNVLRSAHDAHISLSGGLMSAFTFASAWGLSSVSIDGVQLPKVYLTDDLILNQSKPVDNLWQPSALSQINGDDVNDYLSRFAALNSPGALEPHADWNWLMDNPVQDILNSFSTWSGAAIFYPGDSLTYTFENGSTLEDKWVALYNQGDTGPLETGGDFYNFFVLGFYPVSFTPDTTDEAPTASSPALTSLWELSHAYPDSPKIVQKDLGNTGFITGYFIEDASLAVLSVPTFLAAGDAIQTFTDAVQDFIDQSKAAGLERVLIDLQQNEGGDILLAYSLFKQFFPTNEPYAGSIMRAQPLANELGSWITQFWDSLSTSSSEYTDGAGNEWIATIRLNAATGLNFSSWDEFFGPVVGSSGNATLVQRLNVSNYPFDSSMLGDVTPVSLLLSPSTGPPPFAAENIVMLSDGLCSSTCSLFMEMMNHDAGVKNVVIGGRPEYGPMQTPSGSRGAQEYHLDQFDSDIAAASFISEDRGIQLDGLPNRTSLGFYIIDAAISLRAQIRKGDSVPLAMKFEAADCRIFLTPDTFNNFSNLWRYAADAIWTSPHLCVQGSTGYATPADEFVPDQKPPPPAPPATAINYTSAGVPFLATVDGEVPSLVYEGPSPDGPGGGEPIIPTFQIPRPRMPQSNVPASPDSKTPISPLVNNPRVRNNDQPHVKAQKLCSNRGFRNCGGNVKKRVTTF
ncbi:MAG: hypothetical protein Q9227_004324 [Pyrenula ochraceoflavens]